MADAPYREFAKKLIPGEVQLLGVRLPQLRRLAQQLAREGRWQLMVAQDACMEEIMLRGMLIGYARGVSLAERLAALEAFVPYITNWSICDSCCATYRFVRREREEVWRWLAPYLAAAEEYRARFGVVMLLQHFRQEKMWAARVAKALPQVKAQGYYAEMAVAWCACELIIQDPPLRDTLPAALRPSIQRLTLRKLRESTRTR